MSGRVRKPAAPKKSAKGYKMPAPIANGEIIHDTIMKKKWRIGPSIGVGGFGEIYSACDHEASPKGTNYPFVVKIEPHENGPLFVEKHFYVRNANKDDIESFKKSKKLPTFGMPTYFGNGSHDYKGLKYRYLVLERYGKDLWTLFLESGRSFPAATVFQIGLQMLEVLEYIHNRGYVHADIKGANILLGLKKGTENQAYLVDFGLATRISDKEFKPDPKCAHNGTIEYTSRDAHIGVSTMRGDLEILAYNMLQWLVGRLPWESSLKDPRLVHEAKQLFMNDVRTSIGKLGTVPDALVKFFEYITTLTPKQMPDYSKCRQLFESYLKTQGKTRNSKLEFTKKGKSAALDTDRNDTGDAKGNKTAKPKKNVSKDKVDATKKVPKRGRTAKIIPTYLENDGSADDCDSDTDKHEIVQAEANEAKEKANKKAPKRGRSAKDVSDKEISSNDSAQSETNKSKENVAGKRTPKKEHVTKKVTKRSQPVKVLAKDSDEDVDNSDKEVENNDSVGSNKSEENIRKKRPLRKGRKAIINDSSDVNGTDNDSVHAEETKSPRNVTKRRNLVVNNVTETKLAKKGRTENIKVDNCENETPNGSIEAKTKVVRKKRVAKRKSSDPTLLVNVKKTKLAPKGTPPVKRNHANIATQTSMDRSRRSPHVSFDSPISEVIGDKKRDMKMSKDSEVNSSRDIFEDSIEDKKGKAKKTLIAHEVFTVEKVTKKKVAIVKPNKSDISPSNRYVK